MQCQYLFEAGVVGARRQSVNAKSGDTKWDLILPMPEDQPPRGHLLERRGFAS